MYNCIRNGNVRRNTRFFIFPKRKAVLSNVVEDLERTVTKKLQNFLGWKKAIDEFNELDDTESSNWANAH